MIDMMIQSSPELRNNPHARQMLQSPEFRRMMTNPDALRQAAQLRRIMEGGNRGANAFPAPGITDTTPAGAPGTDSNPTPNQPNTTPVNPFLGLGGAGNPFASLFPQAPRGNTPAGTPPPAASAGQGTPSPNAEANAANPFAFLGQPGAFGGGNPMAGLPPNFQMTPEMMQQASEFLRAGGMNDMFGGNPPDFSNLFGGTGGAGSPPAPADTRPPEERYADQLRQLNDMGFFDFDRNVEALRRSGGSVQGAIEQLLR